MKKSGIVLVALLGFACSGSDEQAAPEGPNPAATRARCNAEVVERCSEFQRAEQLDCVRREVEQCLRDARQQP
ncbi:MAG: hypothetical protein GY937_09605 [bacterium]|nr:hypothetical protein [bacterium]